MLFPTASFAGPTRSRHISALIGGLLAISLTSPAWTREPAEADPVVQKRLTETATFLASPELEGRGVGTDGLNRAADYLAEQFKAIGLKTELFDGSPFQVFTVTTESTLGPAAGNTLTLTGPAGEDGTPAKLEMRLGEDFTPLAVGGTAKLDVPLVFAGYGITATDEDYDDYAGIDAKGKLVVVLRHEPQQNNPHSVFEGERDSQYAPIMRKVSNAYEHGAAGIVLVTDENEIKKQVAAHQQRWQTAVNDLITANQEFSKIEEPTLAQIEEHRQKIEKLADEIKDYGQRMTSAYDPVFKFTQGGEGGERRDFPVLHARRGAIDPVIQKALGKSLSELETKIDVGPTPQSALLEGWNASLQTDITRNEAQIKNVVGVLEGEGPHSDETIVIGAHYDHLGYGGFGSFVPDAREIHAGADDNASGTATLLEVARQLAGRQEPLPRRIVFIAFTGEERGLLGSSRYVREPLFPLEKTVAMLNMDMVGRLRDDKLVIYGADTAEQFDPLIERLNKKYGFELTKQPGGFGPSDHAAFYAKQIPVLHFFTGSHEDYHRPSDTAEKLNVEGMQRVGRLLAEAAVELATAEERPKYVESAKPQFAGGGDRPYFGSIPDFTQSEPGYALTGVTKGGPAARAGMRGGDIIVRFGDSKIGNLEDFDSALRKFKAGDRVPVVVKREGKELTLEVTLDPPR